jgi:hypothetical protein
MKEQQGLPRSSRVYCKAARITDKQHNILRSSMVISEKLWFNGE